MVVKVSWHLKTAHLTAHLDRGVALMSCLLMQWLIACCKEHLLVSQLPSEDEIILYVTLYKNCITLFQVIFPVFKPQKHSISSTICLAQDKPWLISAKELA